MDTIDWRERRKRKALADHAAMRAKKTDTYGGPISAPFSVFLERYLQKYLEPYQRVLPKIVTRENFRRIRQAKEAHEASRVQLFKEAARLWEAMSDTDKASYLEKCAADKVLNRPKIKHPHNISAMRAKKTDTYDGPISAPFSVFLERYLRKYLEPYQWVLPEIVTRENFQRIKQAKEAHEASRVQLFKEAARLWEAMSDTDKASYPEKCAADKVGNRPKIKHHHNNSVSELDKSDIPHRLESLCVSVLDKSDSTEVVSTHQTQQLKCRRTRL